MEDLVEQFFEAATVLLIGLVSGYAAKMIHNQWHQMYGVDTMSILGITALLSVLAVAGYYVWTLLTEVEYSNTIAGLTLVSTGVVHYLSHGVLPSFEAVGGVIFWLFTAGSVLNYVLRPDGIEL